ncbi:MAG: putative dehydrogenase, partial [Dokdonia sp.]
MSSRRDFVKKTALVGAGIALAPNLAYSATQTTKDTLRVALIGVGLRGTNHLTNLLQRKDVTVEAICDIDPSRITIAKEHIAKAGFKTPKVFGKDDYDYRNLLEDATIDAVIISTPWLWHTRMAIDAMKAGKYTGVEVSAANTMEECWDLVNTHEETGSHLMILENVNYRRDILAVLNMVKQEVFGELIHFRCGYQHDLRFVKLNDGVTPYGKG